MGGDDNSWSQAPLHMGVMASLVWGSEAGGSGGPMRAHGLSWDKAGDSCLSSAYGTCLDALSSCPCFLRTCQSLF